MERGWRYHPLQGSNAVYESIMDPELEHIIQTRMGEQRWQGDAQ